MAEEKLVEAATKLLSEKGYGGFTLADIGEEAGYSRGLPAHYFGKKEILLSRVATAIVDTYHQRIADTPTDVAGLPRLIQMVKSYSTAGHSIERKALLVLIAEAIIMPEIAQTILALNERGVKAIGREIQAGIASGNIRADADVNNMARIIYAYLRGQMLFTYTDPSFEAGDVSAEFCAMLERDLAPAAG